MIKNPIVGLAFVVTSQQEMLEAKQQELDEKQKKIEELDERIAQEQQKFKEARNDANQEIERQIAYADKLSEDLIEMEKKLQNAQDQSDYFSGEYNRVNHSLLDIKEQQEAIRKRYGWRKWTPETEYDLDRYGIVPMVEGMYRYADDSKASFYDNVLRRDLPMAGMYNINGVNTPFDSELQQRGKFRVEPFDSLVNDGAALVAVRINYTGEFMLLDDFKMPEEE